MLPGALLDESHVGELPRRVTWVTMLLDFVSDPSDADSVYARYRGDRRVEG